MPKSYSMDLRQRVLQYLEVNNNKTKASQLFQVGLSTIHRWVSRKKQTGNVEPLKKKNNYKKLGRVIN